MGCFRGAFPWITEELNVFKVHQYVQIASPFQGPVLSSKDKITVITRDNIRTLKPHTDEYLEQSQISNSKQNKIGEQRTRKKNPFNGGGNGGLFGNNSGNFAKNRAVTLTLDEFDQVKTISTFLTKEDLEKRNSELNNTKLLAFEKAKERRLKMEEYDYKRSSNAKLSTLEKEAKDRANYLLSKATLQLEEQEDDIKHLNELMLYAKCVAIRDAQVEEKKMIRLERKDEQVRLDMMMEVERVSELKKLEEREKRRVEELRLGASMIRVQIEERREAAMLDQERKDQETKLILQAIVDRNEQDKQDKILKIEKSKKLMTEVAKANQESTLRRKQLKIYEEDEDKKVLKYILDKEKREIENDKLLLKKKAERELELSRLRAAQEKLSDKQAQQDALRAQRAHESYEREWRKKEKDAAEKQARLEKELKEERIKQQESREQAIATEAHKMKVEFFANIQKQQEIEVRIKEEEKSKLSKNKQHSFEVKAQIAEKEAHKRKEREEFFMEGIRLAKERKEKLNKIEQIKQRKITELRSLGVPSKYCTEIERKSHQKERLSAFIKKDTGNVKAA